MAVNSFRMACIVAGTGARVVEVLLRFGCESECGGSEGWATGLGVSDWVYCRRNPMVALLSTFG